MLAHSHLEWLLLGTQVSTGTVCLGRLVLGPPEQAPAGAYAACLRKAPKGDAIMRCCAGPECMYAGLISLALGMRALNLRGMLSACTRA